MIECNELSDDAVGWLGVSMMIDDGSLSVNE